MARVLANKDTKEFHDREHEDPRCNLPKMLEDASNVDEFDGFDGAVNAGYEPCRWCIGKWAEE